jgi:hypothetical protein
MDTVKEGQVERQSAAKDIFELRKQLEEAQKEKHD